MRLLTFALAVAVVVPEPSPGQSLLDHASRDTTSRVKKDDEDMAAAIRKARQTLPEFLALIREPRPTITSYAVKIGIPYSEGTEFFWMSPLELRKDDIIGRINNTPRHATSVKRGQRIIFKEKDIVDWLYREAGWMYGNFTACALVKREPPDQAKAFMQKFGIECEP
jgi:uncharacterized protein YegJ (DUF2314 family)